jgi:hypothetical protein
MPCRKILIMCALLLLVMILSNPHPAGAAGVVDQSYTGPATSWNWINSHMPIGQSFKPTMSSLEGVDVGIENVLVMDQSYDPGFAGGNYNWITSHTPIGQSFIPTLPILGAVDVGIYNVETLDQSFNPGFGGFGQGIGLNWVQAHQPIGQSFTPTYPQLWRVDLGLENPFGSPVTLTINIRQGTITGSIIGAQNFTVPVGGPSWISVYFSPHPGLTLIPGNMYVIDLVGHGVSNVRWYAQESGAAYTGGTAITDGVPQLGADYLFTTYGFGNTITLNIRSATIGGSILATKTLPIPPMDFPIMMRFILPTPITLTIGSTYVIELQQTPESVRWYIVDPGGAYPGGMAITDGSVDPNGDYLFNTYGAGNTLIVNVHAGSIGGSLLESLSTIVPVTPQTLFHVDFPVAITVTPGDTYVIELQQNDTQSMRWYIVNPGGGYPNGTAITDDLPYPNGDYIFQTYGNAGATPTSLSIYFAPPSVNIGTSPVGIGSITARITPATLGLPISIYYSPHPAGNWTLIATGNTDGTGAFTVKWTPPAIGIYYFRADFQGDASHMASTVTTNPNSMIAVPGLTTIPLTLAMIVGVFKVLEARTKKK